jgi:hypothetical protein
VFQERLHSRADFAIPFQAEVNEYGALKLDIIFGDQRIEKRLEFKQPMAAV